MKRYYETQWQNKWNNVAIFIQAGDYHERNFLRICHYSSYMRDFANSITRIISCNMLSCDLYVFFDGTDTVTVVARDFLETTKIRTTIPFTTITVELVVGMFLDIFHMPCIRYKFNPTMDDVMSYVWKDFAGWEEIKYNEHITKHELFVTHNVKNTLLLAIYDQFCTMDYGGSTVLNNVDLVFANDYLMTKIIVY